MKTLLLAALLYAPLAHAADTAPAPKADVPVETVKVTDQADQPLFERVRETYIRAEKKGLLAVAAPNTTTAR